METPDKEVATLSLRIDCEQLDLEEVDDLRQFLTSSDSNLKVEKLLRVRTYDSAEYYCFLPSYHDLLVYVVAAGIVGLYITKDVTKNLLEDLIKQWIEERRKSREYEIVTIYGPSDEPVKTVKIFKKHKP